MASSSTKRGGPSFTDAWGREVHSHSAGSASVGGGSVNGAGGSVSDTDERRVSLKIKVPGGTVPNDSDGEGPESEDEMERPQFSGKSLPNSNPKARPKEILGIRDPPCWRCKSLNKTCETSSLRASCMTCYKRHWACSSNAPPPRNKKGRSFLAAATAAAAAAGGSISAPPALRTAKTLSVSSVVPGNKRPRSPSQDLDSEVAQTHKKLKTRASLRSAPVAASTPPPDTPASTSVSTSHPHRSRPDSPATGTTLSSLQSQLNVLIEREAESRKILDRNEKTLEEVLGAVRVLLGRPASVVALGTEVALGSGSVIPTDTSALAPTAKNHTSEFPPARSDGDARLVPRVPLPSLSIPHQNQTDAAHKNPEKQAENEQEEEELDSNVDELDELTPIEGEGLLSIPAKDGDRENDKQDTMMDVDLDLDREINEVVTSLFTIAPEKENTNGSTTVTPSTKPATVSGPAPTAPSPTAAQTPAPTSTVPTLNAAPRVISLSTKPLLGNTPTLSVEGKGANKAKAKGKGKGKGLSKALTPTPPTISTVTQPTIGAATASTGLSFSNLTSNPSNSSFMGTGRNTRSTSNAHERSSGTPPTMNTVAMGGKEKQSIGAGRGKDKDKGGLLGGGKEGKDTRSPAASAFRAILGGPGVAPPPPPPPPPIASMTSVGASSAVLVEDKGVAEKKNTAEPSPTKILGFLNQKKTGDMEAEEEKEQPTSSDVQAQTQVAQPRDGVPDATQSTSGSTASTPAPTTKRTANPKSSISSLLAPAPPSLPPKPTPIPTTPAPIDHQISGLPPKPTMTPSPNTTTTPGPISGLPPKPGTTTGTSSGLPPPASLKAKTTTRTTPSSRSSRVIERPELERGTVGTRCLLDNEIAIEESNTRTPLSPVSPATQSSSPVPMTTTVSRNARRPVTPMSPMSPMSSQGGEGSEDEGDDRRVDENRRGSGKGKGDDRKSMVDGRRKGVRDEEGAGTGTGTGKAGRAPETPLPISATSPIRTKANANLSSSSSSSSSSPSHTPRPTPTLTHSIQSGHLPLLNASIPTAPKANTNVRPPPLGPRSDRDRERDGDRDRDRDRRPGSEGGRAGAGMRGSMGAGVGGWREVSPPPPQAPRAPRAFGSSSAAGSGSTASRYGGAVGSRSRSPASANTASTTAYRSSGRRRTPSPPPSHPHHHKLTRDSLPSRPWEHNNNHNGNNSGNGKMSNGRGADRDRGGDRERDRERYNSDVSGGGGSAEQRYDAGDEGDEEEELEEEEEEEPYPSEVRHSASRQSENVYTPYGHGHGSRR